MKAQMMWKIRCWICCAEGRRWSRMNSSRNFAASDPARASPRSSAFLLECLPDIPFTFCFLHLYINKGLSREWLENIRDELEGRTRQAASSGGCERLGRSVLGG